MNKIKKWLEDKDSSLIVRVISIVLVVLFSLAMTITYLIDVIEINTERDLWVNGSNKVVNDRGQNLLTKAYIVTSMSFVAFFISCLILRYTFKHKRIFYYKLTIIPILLISIGFLLIHGQHYWFWEFYDRLASHGSKGTQLFAKSEWAVKRTFEASLSLIGIFGIGYMLCIGHGIYINYIFSNKIK